MNFGYECGSNDICHISMFNVETFKGYKCVMSTICPFMKLMEDLIWNKVVYTYPFPFRISFGGCKD